MGERDKGLLGGCYYSLVSIFAVVVPVRVPQLRQNDVFYIAFRVHDTRVLPHGSPQVVAPGTCDLASHKGEAAGVVGIVPVLGRNRPGAGRNRMKSGSLVTYSQ